MPVIVQIGGDQVNGSQLIQNLSLSALSLSGTLTPPALEGDALGTPINNYSPTGLAASVVVLQDVSTVDPAFVSGLAGGTGGKFYVWINVSTTNTFSFVDESLDSDPENRFILGGQLGPGAVAITWYDVDASRWRVIAGNQLLT